MIKFHEQVHMVYSRASRDFQYLGWLINIVLNSVKHNVDGIYDLPNSKADPKLTELLAMTLGFKVKRNYDQDQLRALVAALPRILKYKGTKAAVDMAGHAILAASGASGSFLSEVQDGTLIVTFPVNLVDISLFTDLLNYILPAGMTCQVRRENLVTKSNSDEFAYEDHPIAGWVEDVIDMDDVNWDTETVGGLVNGLYQLGGEPIFANYKDANQTVNLGLLDTGLIPILTESHRKKETASVEETDTENGDTSVEIGGN
jgi:hypothetical protein